MTVIVDFMHPQILAFIVGSNKNIGIKIEAALIVISKNKNI